MKAIFFLFSLLLLGTLSFAQNREYLISNAIPYFANQDTTWSFSILGPEKQQFLDNFTDFAGVPAANSTGIIQWNNMTIEGIGSGLCLKIKDGILTHNTETRSACFVPFKNEKDKQEKLAGLQENQERMMELEMKNSKGLNFEKDDKEKASMDFLTRIYKKS